MNFEFASRKHQQSAALLLAYTAKTYMPILQPIASKAYPWGFCVDFLFSNTFDETLILLLTEEMRRNVAKDLALKPMSMVPKNAYDFLKKKEPLLAEMLLHANTPLVELVAINDFYDLAEHETVLAAGECKDFVLVSIEKKWAFYEALGDVEVVQIQGAVMSCKKDVKQYVKAHALVKKHGGPLQEAKNEKLVVLDDGHPLWCAHGIAFYEQVKNFWKDLCKTHGITELLAPSAYLFDAHLHYLQDNFTKPAVRSGQWSQNENILLPQEYEGLFQTKELLGDSIFRLCTNEAVEDECISSLQFIEKLHTMIGLDFGIVFICSRAKNSRAIQERLQGCMKRHGFVFSQENAVQGNAVLSNAQIRIEARAYDKVGRAHTISFVQIETAQDARVFAEKVLITQQSICSLERMLALLLEQRKWNLEDTKTLES